MSSLDRDFIEADEWEMEQTINDINKILKGEIGAEEIEKKLKAKEEKKKRENPSGNKTKGIKRKITKWNTRKR